MDCGVIVVVGWYLIVGVMCDDVCFVVDRFGGWSPRMNFVMMEGVHVIDLCDHLCSRIVLVSVLVHRVDAVGCVMVCLIGIVQVRLYLLVGNVRLVVSEVRWGCQGSVSDREGVD